jgi:AraC-like DNA-binding protein
MDVTSADWSGPSHGSGARAPGVLASAATGIGVYIEECGGDVDRIFGDAHILPDIAGSPTLKLRLSDFVHLFEESARQTGNENFGLWFGNRFLPRDLGMWGYAAISAPTLGAALECLVRLFRYHQESSVMRLSDDRNGLVRLEYRIVAPAIVERRQDAELSLGMFLNVLRECCGCRWSPEEVHFEHPKPSMAREHQTAFGAPVYFSQPTNALLFRPDILARPMPSRDPKLLAVMQTCLEQLGSQPADEDILIDRMRTAIRMKLPSGYPSFDEIAGDLRASAGTMRQDLQAAGLTYKDIVEDVRRELALSYLKQRHLPFSEIAMLLGYSELSAFSRAFRRWTGASPREYRARMLNA